MSANATPAAPPRRSGFDISGFLTAEFVVYAVIVIGVFIASALIDVDKQNQGFSAHAAWSLVTWLTIGFLVSRGLAKSGWGHLT